jgi:hypothetical protein
VKVSELEGDSLDYWALRADGWEDDRPQDLQMKRDGQHCLVGVAPAYACNGHQWRSPSTDWARGGIIIERERIHLEPFPDDEWMAFERADGWGEPLEDSPLRQYGPTPLIAAMRAYVALKFGEEVEDAQPESAG